MKLFHEHHKRFALATALMTVLVLTGCASNPSRITESSTLQAGQGIVTLRIVTLHERTLSQLTIKNIDSDEVVNLVPQSPLGGNSVRFTGTAAAGRYRTINLHGSDVEQLGYAQRVRTLTVPLDRPANTFEVASGKLTNLGSLIFTPMDRSRFVAPAGGDPDCCTRVA